MTFFKKRSFLVCAAIGEGCVLALTALQKRLSPLVMEAPAADQGEVQP